jgi:hypothetical protein
VFDVDVVVVVIVVVIAVDVDVDGTWTWSGTLARVDRVDKVEERDFVVCWCWC